MSFLKSHFCAISCAAVVVTAIPAVAQTSQNSEAWGWPGLVVSDTFAVAGRKISAQGYPQLSTETVKGPRGTARYEYYSFIDPTSKKLNTLSLISQDGASDLGVRVAMRYANYDQALEAFRAWSAKYTKVLGKSIDVEFNGVVVKRFCASERVSMRVALDPKKFELDVGSFVNAGGSKMCTGSPQLAGGLIYSTLPARPRAYPAPKETSAAPQTASVASNSAKVGKSNGSAKSQTVLLAECQSGLRVSCYDLARNIDIAAKSSYSKNEIDLMKYGYNRSCELKFVDACFNLSLAYDRKMQMYDTPNALIYARKGCSLGDQESCKNVGLLQELLIDAPCNQSNQMVDNPATRAEALRLAMTRPNRPGCLYARGLISQKQSNYGDAMRLYKLAAQMGHPYAMNNIGDLYNHGYGVKVDYAESLKWFHRARAAMNTAEWKGQDEKFVALIDANIVSSNSSLRAPQQSDDTPVFSPQSCHKELSYRDNQGNNVLREVCN